MARRAPIKNTEELILRAREKHFDKYDYTRTAFVNSQTPVIINCPTHGDFRQLPGVHVRGSGCNECGRAANIAASKKDINHFLQRAKKVHGDKYDYSKSVYVGSGLNLTIICKDHGEFQQTPENHYAGKGCERCSRVVGQADFIAKAKIIHDNRYTYDNVVYVDSQTKVAITCPTHGDFHQVPASHITGYGCIHCKNSIGEEKIFQLLKQNGIPFEAQKTFPELRLDLPLRLDFYLPDINTAIEFDGIQHQVALEIFGGEEGLKKRQERDRAKTEYCEANNIRMIRVWYNQNPENVLREHGIIP